MKSLVLLVVLLGAISAQAGFERTINCKLWELEDKGTVTLAVKNFHNSDLMDLNEIYTDYEGEPTGVTYDHEDMEWVWYLLLSRDSTFTTDDAGNIYYQLDNDGCDVGEFVLYKNNGYRFGYISVDHKCSGPELTNTYSRARCSIK